MARLAEEACCARLPAASLPALAGLRGRPGLEVAQDGDVLWVRWRAGDAATFAEVFPVAGAEMFRRQAERWLRPGCRLPAAGPTAGLDWQPLEHVLYPEPVSPEAPGETRIQPVPLSLIENARPRRATALRCRVDALGMWAGRATSSELASVRAAVSEGQVVMLGDRLPLLPGAERFWGRRLFVPLGFGLRPAIPEAELLSALGVRDEEAALFDSGGVEVLPLATFCRLSRASARLAARGSES